MQSTQLTGWDSTEYDALTARLRTEYRHRRRNNLVVVGVVWGAGFWGLVYAVWTIATWMTR